MFDLFSDHNILDSRKKGSRCCQTRLILNSLTNQKHQGTKNTLLSIVAHKWRSSRESASFKKNVLLPRFSLSEHTKLPSNLALSLINSKLPVISKQVLDSTFLAKSF